MASDPKMKITTHLPSTTPAALHRATTHPFLALAGTGQLPKRTLAAWLSQDRLYAQSYVRFIGLLLSKINLPNEMPALGGLVYGWEYNQLAKEKGHKTIPRRVMGILIDALNNIQRELEFFEVTAINEGIELNEPLGELGYEEPPLEEGEEQNTFRPGAITQGYIDMFMSAASPGASLLEGLVVLWATEICYLKAWRYAQAQKEEQGVKQRPERDLDGGILRKEFIPNWASVEFEKFVEKIGEVVDEVAELELESEQDAKGVRKEGMDGLLVRCENWWRRVVWLEERFWPRVE